MMGVSNLAIAKILFSKGYAAPATEWCPLIRVEQKPVSLMVDIFKNRCPAKGAILYYCTDTKSAAKTRFYYQNTYNFFERDRKDYFLTRDMPSSSELFVRQVLCNDSCINITEDI